MLIAFRFIKGPHFIIAVTVYVEDTVTENEFNLRQMEFELWEKNYWWLPNLKMGTIDLKAKNLSTVLN